jgi:hypothetical protein
MKYLLTFILLAAFSFVDPAFSQISKGNKELSLAASYMSRKYASSAESWDAVNVVFGLGYFLTRSLEIEPELLYAAYEDSESGWILSGNVAYNITIGNESDLVPFFLAGLGYSNTFLFLPRSAYPGEGDDKWTVLNAGGGLKIMTVYPAVFRLEYRFQIYQGDRDITNHLVLIGISAFLK